MSKLAGRRLVVAGTTDAGERVRRSPKGWELEDDELPRVASPVALRAPDGEIRGHRRLAAIRQTAEEVTLFLGELLRR